MRIAVLIIGLMLTIGLFIQSLLIAALSDAANSEHDGADGGTGMVMALMWLVACGLVIPFPLVSVVLFAVAGLIGVVSAGPLDFPDLAVWGVVSFVLAVFSIFGWRGKIKKERKEAARDAAHAQSLAAQQQMAAQMAYMQQQMAYQQQHGYVQQPGQWHQQPPQGGPT
jgi:hypothetical protein